MFKKLFTTMTVVFFALLIVTLQSQEARAGFLPSNLKYHTLKTEHFSIHFPEGLGPVAKEMQIISEEAYQNIVTRLDWQPWGRTHVVLTDKSDKANGMATVLPYNYILLYITSPDADSNLDHYKDYWRMLFNHEFSHIVHIDKHYRWATPARFLFGRVIAPNGATPGWMREGMAVYEESALDPGFGRIHHDETMMVLRTAYYENVFPRIDQIAGLTKHFPGGDGQYLFGGMFFDWLAKRYGEERMYKFQKEYASSLWLFSLNNKARRVYGKSFYKLYKEFKSDYTAQFDAQQHVLSAQGVTPLEDVVKNGDSQTQYTPTPYPGGYAYFEESLDKPSAIHLLTKKFDDTASETITFDAEQKLKRSIFGQMSFSKSGRYLAFSALSRVKPQTLLSEVYYYDLKKKTLMRVLDTENPKQSLRVMDPDFSPADGGQRWLVMVRNFLGTDQLYIYDLFEKKGYVITNEPEKTQLSNPRFSPDGSKIAVSRKDPLTGHRDIVVYTNQGSRLVQITNDIKPDQHPIFSNDGRFVYYDSYKTGIANIFRHELLTNTTTQVTNVLDGVFQPMPDPASQAIFVKRYSSEHTFIQKFYPTTIAQNVADVVPLLSTISDNNIIGTPPQIRTTNPHYSLPITHYPSSLRPSSLRPAPASPLLSFSQDPTSDERIPQFLYEEDPEENEEAFGTVKETRASPKDASAKKTYPSAYKNTLSSKPSDVVLDTTNPEGTKNYHALPELLVPRYLLPGLLYYENSFLVSAAIGRTDPLYRHSWSAFANYRSDAAFVGGGGTYMFSRYKPLFYVGGLRYAVDWGTINGINFFEERNQAYAGMSWGIKAHRFNLAYFYEHRSALTNLNVNLINMMPYAGSRFQYTFSKYKMYADSISPENGVVFKVGGEWTDSMLGSDAVNEEIALRGDLRFYLEMPWSDHHVLALRTAVGWVWGDQQQFGDYRLGGPFGEGTGASYSSRVFPLRGLAGITYGGDYAYMFSSEYRIPLATNVNWGIGTWPIFLDKLYMALFVDGGDIKYRTETNELFSRMLVSTGAEVNGNFVLGYGLPLTIRAGYGVILTNRWRLGTLTDSITMMSLKYGSVYLQFGTMF